MSNMPTASATPTTTTAASASPAPARKRRAARSQTLDATIARARVVADALVPLLARLAAADADAASVRIDAAWVTNLNSVIAQAEDSQGERATALVAQKEATKVEHQVAVQLVSRLVTVRELVATHASSDVGAQQAFGRGANISSKGTTKVLEIAQGFLKAYAGQWKDTALAAGVTQAMIDEVSSLADQLAKAGTAQQTVKTSGSQGVLSREAAIAALRSMSAYAVRVVTGVFGRGSPQLATLADPRPLQARGKARKAATKAKAKAKAAQARAQKAASRAKPGARGKTRARKAKRAIVAVQRATLVKGALKTTSRATTASSSKAASTLAEPVSHYKKTSSKAKKVVSNGAKPMATASKPMAKREKTVSKPSKAMAAGGKVMAKRKTTVAKAEKTSAMRGKTGATGT